MSRILIVSVGGSLEPVLEAIRRHSPVFVYFLCSAGKAGSSDAVEQTIIPRTQLSQDRYLIVHVDDPDNLRAVNTACAQIEKSVDERLAMETSEVIVNYTGGTKTMSSGLVLLAAKRRWEAEVTPRIEPRTSGPISSVELKALTVFEDVKIAFAEQVNVIIGENGTGKTHLLKAMYGLLRAAEETGTMPLRNDRGDKLERVFAGNFRRNQAEPEQACSVSVECARGQFSWVKKGVDANWTLPADVRVRALFLPSREPLSMFTGFERAYEQRVLSFDETYYDIIRNLNQTALREDALDPTMKAVVAEIEGIIGGGVQLDFNEFVLATNHGKLKAQMVAEGHRKLACLAYLIKNGTLTQDTILFWDEPEANLNPKLAGVVARIIRLLASGGVQIILATHDYLFARYVSLMAIYDIAPIVDTAFFALYRKEENAPVEVESGEYLSYLEQNPIIAGFQKHYDDESAWFGGERGEKG